MTPTKLLTALHGIFRKNDKFEIIDRHGISRQGFVKETWYESSKIDIAVIELNAGSTAFRYFMPVNNTPVKLGGKLYVMSRRAVDAPDEYTECVEDCSVTAVIKNTAIVHSRYYAEAGMSGCGVVATRVGSNFALVGVHVASHDKTVAVEAPVRKRKKGAAVTAEEFHATMMTVNSNIHGHGSYSLICEAARIPELMSMLVQS